MTDTLIGRNPQILGGTPVFAGTRVPVRILMEHLEAGDRLAELQPLVPGVLEVLSGDPQRRIYRVRQ